MTRLLLIDVAIFSLFLVVFIILSCLTFAIGHFLYTLIVEMFL